MYKYPSMQTNNNMNIASNQFKTWCDYNRLTLNLAKCKVVQFCTSIRKINELPIINIGGTQLDFITEFKYLGILLNKYLKFSAHVNFICLKKLKRSYLHFKKSDRQYQEKMQSHYTKLQSFHILIRAMSSSIV